MTSMSASSCKFSISFPANYLFLLLQAKLGEGLSLQASLGNNSYAEMGPKPWFTATISYIDSPFILINPKHTCHISNVVVWTQTYI